ncbi:hypothetical protein QBK93_31015 [Rhizobium leguminosarum]|uniref:hypothetical protein n=1 Tax=Rhizobium leguminosarum TaxID=384 RepID=UPI0024A90B3D|nr:hypothetical protein [Rhizobium leguminosarum]MDI5929077.1 hypothetical protein [Rhizobium leguminosarum]
MEKVWNRDEAEAEAATLFDAARMTPQTVLEHDGKFIVKFEPGVKVPLSEWAVRPGTLEDEDVL